MMDKNLSGGLCLLETPILILVYNRIDTVDKVFERIKQVKPRRLYISCDGPRLEVEGDEEKVLAVREFLLGSIDWECEVSTLFRDINLGCRDAVDGAIKWFFDNEEKGIILEDDTLPEYDFFFIMEEMLVKYKEHKYISSISGRFEADVDDYSMEGKPFQSAKFWCWGWASWRDRVAHLNVEEGYSSGGVIDAYRLSHSLFDFLHVRSMQVQMRGGYVNSWAWAYDLSFRKRNMRSLVVPFNLVQNVGLNRGTHSTFMKEDWPSGFMSRAPISLPDSIFFDRGYVGRALANRLGGSKLKTFAYLIVGCFPKLKRFLKSHS